MKVVACESVLNFDMGRGHYRDCQLCRIAKKSGDYLLLLAAFSARVPMTVPNVSKLGKLVQTQ